MYKLLIHYEMVPTGYPIAIAECIEADTGMDTAIFPDRADRVIIGHEPETVQDLLKSVEKIVNDATAEIERRRALANDLPRTMSIEI